MQEVAMVVGVHAKNKDEVEVSYKGQTIKVKNMIHDLKVGEYVQLEGDLIIGRAHKPKEF
jgi:hypothetical protein